MLGSFVLSSGYYDAYYLKALRVKALIKKAFDEAFAKYDVILGPVAPTTAPKLGSSLSDPIKMYLGDIYLSKPCRTSGLSVPCGKDRMVFQSAYSSLVTALKRIILSVQVTLMSRHEEDLNRREA